MEKESDLDWAILKKPLVILCVCFVIASALIGSSYYFNSSLEKEYKNNKSAKVMFAYSIFYLFALFTALIADYYLLTAS